MAAARGGGRGGGRGRGCGGGGGSAGVARSKCGHPSRELLKMGNDVAWRLTRIRAYCVVVSGVRWWPVVSIKYPIKYVCSF